MQVNLQTNNQMAVRSPLLSLDLELMISNRCTPRKDVQQLERPPSRLALPLVRSSPIPPAQTLISRPSRSQLRFDRQRQLGLHSNRLFRCFLRRSFCSCWRWSLGYRAEQHGGINLVLLRASLPSPSRSLDLTTRAYQRNCSERTSLPTSSPPTPPRSPTRAPGVHQQLSTRAHPAVSTSSSTLNTSSSISLSAAIVSHPF